ncbi:fimbrillin family protein [Phocaeicola sp.]
MKSIQNLIMLSVLAGAVCFSSCSKDEEMNEVNNGEVRFAAGIGQQATTTPTTTRASGTQWAAGDKIGIFMVKHGALTISESAANRKYTTATGNGMFTPINSDAIYYPMDNSKVDFIAYYPHADAATLDVPLPVAIATVQTPATQAAFDLLWAKADNSGNGYSKATITPVALSFGHCLAKFTMNCKLDASVGVSNLDGTTVTITGMHTQNTFDLKTGTLGTPGTPADITPRRLDQTAATYNASYDAIILPANYAAGIVSVAFKIGSETFTWSVEATEFKPGNEYIYEVTITRTDVRVEGTIVRWNPVEIQNPVIAE